MPTKKDKEYEKIILDNLSKKDKDPLLIINTIRDSFIGAEEVYTKGSCYQFYKILKIMFPEAICYYDCYHVITKIGDKYYDITGEIDGSKHIEATDADLKGIKDCRYMISKFNKFQECSEMDEYKYLALQNI